ncbi:MAG: ABC transporter permease, partial [Alphaproteobacteria bacterium]|nr:ABC transporter permease [Alphaproteobacteria bacterium]
MTATLATATTSVAREPAIGVLSQRQLLWRRFKRHKAAYVSLYLIAALYVVVLFAEFFAPYDPFTRHTSALLAPPSGVHLFDENWSFQWRPFVYGRKAELDRRTFQRVYAEDRNQRFPVRFFVRGDSYHLLGLFETNMHLFGVDRPGGIFLAGTDSLGRDLFSRMLFGARTSLFVGLLGLALGFTLGLFFGGLSGYYGGGVDTAVQRLTEFLQSMPTLPLWMALAALVPKDWTPVQVYFGISTVLAIIGWTG